MYKSVTKKEDDNYAMVLHFTEKHYMNLKIRIKTKKKLYSYIY